MAFDNLGIGVDGKMNFSCCSDVGEIGILEQCTLLQVSEYENPLFRVHSCPLRKNL